MASKYIFNSIEDVQSFVEQNKITSRNDFQSRFQAAYNKVRNMDGWVDILFPKKKPYTQYSFDEAKEFVEKGEYKNINALNNEYSTLARHIAEMGWKNDIFPKHFTDYTLDDMRELVDNKGIKTRSEFSNKYSVLYDKAHDTKDESTGLLWIDILFPPIKPYTQYTLDDMRELIDKEGLDYDGFRNKYKSLFNRAWKEEYDGVKWIYILFPSSKRYSDYTLDEVIELVEREHISGRLEFLKKYRRLYEVVSEKGWLDIVFPESIHPEYPKYTKRQDITKLVKEFLEHRNAAIALPPFIMYKLFEATGNPAIRSFFKQMTRTAVNSENRREMMDQLEKDFGSDEVSEDAIENLINMGKDINDDELTEDEVWSTLKDSNACYDIEVKDYQHEESIEDLKEQMNLVDSALKTPAFQNIVNHGDIIKTIVNYYSNKIIINSFDNDNYLENVL